MKISNKYFGFVSLLTACGGPPQIEDPPTRSRELEDLKVQVINLPSGDINYPAGGIQVVSYTDKNQNGMLDTEEARGAFSFHCN